MRRCDPSGLIYAPPANQSTPATVVVNVSDLGNIGLGPALLDTDTITINVAPVNDAPVLNVSSAPIAYVENAAPTLLDAAATLTDIDSADFDTGVVTVQMISADAADRLSVRNEGTAVGQIGVSGNTITFEGLNIGTQLSGQAGGDLTIQLTNLATPAAVTALLRNLQFAATSENPTTTARSLVVSVSDGDGGATTASTITANVTAVNDAPVVNTTGRRCKLRRKRQPDHSRCCGDGQRHRGQLGEWNCERYDHKWCQRQ